MNDLSAYIHDELKKIPFNIFNIIYKYTEENQDTKVAFVGGYIRDLLITKFHSKVFSKPLDIDIVIEGSSIDLAKFIKKNISNVDLCLIKEFNLYNTVELNINDLKIDIASSRKEIYNSPGLNPTVENTTIKEDLRRRDFSVNAIAYEISTGEIYDLYEGIKHIKVKKLNLLHKNSIEDDPSRLIRCAKYSSRLEFNISKDSLKQCQKTVQKWPWKISKNKEAIIFPPAISIRIRMELSEIYKYDNLAKILYKLDKWKTISILSESIQVNKNFLRGLRWVKKLKGNYILFILKNTNDLEYSSLRFFLNNKEKKIIEDYLKIKRILEIEEKKYLDFSTSNLTEFIEKRNLNTETVKLLICDGGIYWRPFFRWLFVYRFIKAKKDGQLLKKEGWNPGKEMGNEIKRLRYLEIDKIRKN